MWSLMKWTSSFWQVSNSCHNRALIEKSKSKLISYFINKSHIASYYVFTFKLWLEKLDGVRSSAALCTYVREIDTFSLKVKTYDK